MYIYELFLLITFRPAPGRNATVGSDTRYTFTMFVFLRTLLTDKSI